MTTTSLSDKEYFVKDEVGHRYYVHIYPKNFLEEIIFPNDKNLLFNLGAMILAKESLHRKFMKKNSAPIHSVYCGRYGIGFICDMVNEKSSNYCRRRYYVFKKPIEDGIFLLCDRRIASDEERARVRFFSNFVSEHNFMYGEFLLDNCLVQGYNLAAFMSEKVN